MDASKVDLFMMMNSKYFDGFQLQSVRQMLTELPDEKWGWVQTLQFKDPTFVLIISLLAGSLGIDRFFIGDTGLGLGKLLTCGGFGIWSIVDWFLIMSAAKERNYRKLQEVSIR
ncbi:MAG: TM2 domain-containing protein [Dysgonamonadaceae bacterium]|nr:TM2 domain-containing protein [Dysgonamonadaceae bacterium]